MSDEKGIDVSAFVPIGAIEPPESFGDVLPNGVKHMGPVTIAGTCTWLACNQARCATCGQIFTVQPDGPTPHLTAADLDYGPVCDPCAAAILSAPE